MRRLFASYVFLCAAVCLVAATPRPTAKPTPQPSAMVHLNLPSTEPVVLIYPFDTASGLDAKVGVQVANIFSHALTEGQSITVLPIGTGVARSSFLTNAHAKKADYYITGYITPIGDSASVVVQVVSVQSGVIVFAQTSQVSDINDAISLGLTSRSAILQMSGTTVDVQTDETATAAPTSQATNGASFNLGKLFTHHSTHVAARATEAPSSKPQRGVILVSVRNKSGATSDDLHTATQLLDRDLAAHFATRNGGAAPASLVTAADSICGSERDNTIATGLLDQQHVGGIRPHVRTEFTLQIWTCFGAVLYQTTESDLNIAKAISSAVNDYVTAHPDNS